MASWSIFWFEWTIFWLIKWNFTSFFLFFYLNNKIILIGRRTTTPHPYKNGRMTAQYVEYYQTGDDAWDEYKRKYNKNYKPSDEKEKYFF